jgi:hypothetical protein
MNLPDWARGFLALVVVALFASCTSQVRVHADGDGPLAWTGDSRDVISMDALRPPGNDAITFGGMNVCVADSRHPATILAVGPVTTVGAPLEVVGIKMRTIPPGGNLIGSLAGFDPASWEGSARDAVGSSVAVQCVNGHFPPSEVSQSELLIGLRATTDDGGGWDGVAITYTYDDKSYTVELSSQIAICAADETWGCYELFGIPRPPDAPPAGT